MLAILGVLALAVVLSSAWNHEALRAWQRQASPLPFFIAMAIVPAVGVPATPLYILAGATFGTRLGLVGTVIALGVNLALCYRISHGALRPRLVSFLRRHRYELPNFQERDRAAAVRFTVLVKLAPGVPIFVKNYVLGLSGVPWALYFSLSMLINGVYAALFVVLGEALPERDLRRILAPAALLALVVVGLWEWYRRGSRGRRERLA